MKYEKEEGSTETIAVCLKVELVQSDRHPGVKTNEKMKVGEI